MAFSLKSAWLPLRCSEGENEPVERFVLHMAISVPSLCTC